MEKIKLVDDHYCFACGMENKQGLLIDWKIDGKKTFAEFVPKREYQGWKDVVHGGIIATLLDEAMTRLAWVTSGGALTAEMTVRFLVPAKTGERIYIEGEVLKENRRIVEMKSTLRKESHQGPKIAYATGKAVKISQK